MKAKGLIVKDFPKHWTNWQNPDKPNDYFTKEEIEFNNKLLIEKRPYFMKYLYPTYKAQYKEYRKKYNYLCYMKFGITIDELLQIKNKTIDQQQLENNYYKFNPFLENSSPMNEVCWYMERQIKQVKINAKKRTPDYIFNILFDKNISITEKQVRQMENVFKRYRKNKNKSMTSGELLSLDDLSNLNKDTEEFDFEYISDDLQRLANLAVYVNYYLYPNSPKNFCWDLFGEGIILNIYNNTNNKFEIPLLDKEGDIEYMEKKYKNKGVNVICQ